jgi:hypothetical protein
VSQIEAQYQNTPKGMFSCATCTFFIKPRSCKVVTGDISPTGWCKLFDLPGLGRGARCQSQGESLKY